jgi:hypothetical protein
MSRNWRGWFGVLGLAGFCVTAQARVMPAFDLPAMIEGANVIVAARVLAREYRGPVTNEAIPIRITLGVARTIKGDPHAASAPLTVDFVDTPSFDGNPFIGDFAIFFLRCAGTAVCEPASKNYLSMLALPRGPARADRPAGVVPALVEEMMALVAAPDAELAPVTHVAAASDAERGSVARWHAVHKLKSLLRSKKPLDPSMLERLKSLARSPEPGPRLAAVSVLADAKDVTMLRYVERDVVNPSADYERLVLSVASAATQVGDHLPADYVDTMARWLGSRHKHVRQDVAQVLRELATPAAGRVLAKAGLDDPDPDVRYLSVTGLMAAFGDGNYPSTTLYKTDEPGYRDPWLRWREANRASIDLGTCCERPKPPPEPVGRSVRLPSPPATKRTP